MFWTNNLYYNANDIWTILKRNYMIYTILKMLLNINFYETLSLNLIFPAICMLPSLIRINFAILFQESFIFCYISIKVCSVKQLMYSLHSLVTINWSNFRNVPAFSMIVAWLLTYLYQTCIKWTLKNSFFPIFGSDYFLS